MRSDRPKSPRRKSRLNECGHPEREHYALGKCKSCWAKARKQTSDRIVAVGKPEVADHIAKAIIANNMDTEQAVEKVIAPDASPAERADLVDKIKDSPQVQSALKMNLVAKGLDEDSQKEYVARLWHWFTDDRMDWRKAVTAARILGKAFVQEKAQDNKPMELKIDGFGEGLKAMLGGAQPKVPEGERADFDSFESMESEDDDQLPN